MTNLANRPPLGLKKPKPKKNAKYLVKIRQMPCCVCEKFHEVQLSPTTAHHPIHDRFSTGKRPDNTAIPLCEGHHQGLWDQSKIAIHKQPLEWEKRYGKDYKYSADKID